MVHAMRTSHACSVIMAYRGGEHAQGFIMSFLSLVFGCALVQWRPLMRDCMAFLALKAKGKQP